MSRTQRRRSPPGNGGPHGTCRNAAHTNDFDFFRSENAPFMLLGRGADGPKKEKRGSNDAHDAWGGEGPERFTGRGTEPMMLVMPLSEESCETFFPARAAYLARARAPRLDSCFCCMPLPPRGVARPWAQPLKSKGFLGFRFRV